MSTTHPRAAPAGTMTYEEFLNWADEDTAAEWVDGKVIMPSPASAKHQLLVVFWIKLLSLYAEYRQLGVVLAAPFQMKLPHSGREPDVLFVAQDHLDRLHDTYLDGPADLVIEVISVPESVERDRVDKFREYQAGGVPEYWLLDPDSQQAEFYQRDAQGVFQRVRHDAQGIYRSRAVPGFWLNVAWLWQEPLPSVEQLLLQMAGPDYIRVLLERAGDDPRRALLTHLQQDQGPGE